MVDKAELRRVHAFTDLPDEQLDWFLSKSEEVLLKSGDIYMRQGDPANSMFVILDGQLQARGELGGETVVVTARAGDVTGVLPYSRMKQTPLTGRALTDVHGLRFPSALFPELVHIMPRLAER